MPHDPTIADCDRGELLQALEQSLGVARPCGSTYPTTTPCRGLERSRGLQHRVGLADTRGSAKEDPQAAALSAGLFGLDVGQELIGVGPYFGHVAC